jgi:hypothetical protein
VAVQIAEFGVLSQAIVYRRSCLSTGMISAGMPDLGFPRDVSCRAAAVPYRRVAGGKGPLAANGIFGD